MTPARGLTLVELLLSIALSGVLLVASLGWLQTIRAVDAADRTTEHSDLPARNAIRVIREAIGTRTAPPPELSSLVPEPHRDSLAFVDAGILTWFGRAPMRESVTSSLSRVVFDEALGTVAISTRRPDGRVTRSVLLTQVRGFTIRAIGEHEAVVTIERDGRPGTRGNVRW